MSDGIFNVAKGKVAEYAARVNANDPANSAFILVPVDRGSVTDGQMRDFTTLAAVLAGGVTERSTSGWSRKTITDAGGITITVDQANDRTDVDMPDPSWTPTAGAVTDVLFCFDSDTSAGTDANLVPCVWLGFAITPDGSLCTLQLDPAGFYRAA